MGYTLHFAHDNSWPQGEKHFHSFEEARSVAFDTSLATMSVVVICDSSESPTEITTVFAGLGTDF